jgi:hypothetical protein
MMGRFFSVEGSLVFGDVRFTSTHEYVRNFPSPQILLVIGRVMSNPRLFILESGFLAVCTVANISAISKLIRGSGKWALSNPFPL